MSKNGNTRYTKEYIEAEVGLEPTLMAIQDNIILVGYLFPNSPTTLQIWRLKKYRYFKDIRTALTHTLKANWDIFVDNYYETKTYSNFLDDEFIFSGNIFEIGAFQEMLDEYKETDICKKIIQQKKASGGKKSGVTKRAMSKVDRRKLTAPANEKRAIIAKDKLNKVIEHIKDTEIEPNFSIRHIVEVSKEVGDSGLCHKTVAKYLDKTLELKV